MSNSTSALTHTHRTPAASRTAIVIGAAAGALISVLMAVIKVAPLGPSHAVLIAAVCTPYLTFAAHDGRPSAVIAEVSVVTAFFVAALVLLDGSIIAIAIVLALHAVWDVFHIGRRICDVVWWWPAWCASLDLTAAVTLVVIDTWFV